MWLFEDEATCLINTYCVPVEGTYPVESFITLSWALLVKNNYFQLATFPTRNWKKCLLGQKPVAFFSKKYTV